MNEIVTANSRHRFNAAFQQKPNKEAAFQGKWRRTPYPERKYERLPTKNVVCAGLSELDEKIAKYELQTSLPDSFVGIAYKYEDNSGKSEAWMKSVLSSETGGQGKKKAEETAVALAKDEGVIRAQVTTCMEALLIAVQDRVMTDAGVLLQPELRSANWETDSASCKVEESIPKDAYVQAISEPVGSEPIIKDDGIGEKKTAADDSEQKQTVAIEANGKSAENDVQLLSQTGTLADLSSTSCGNTRPAGVVNRNKDVEVFAAGKSLANKEVENGYTGKKKKNESHPDSTPDIVEQPVWGIDCYTRRNILICLSTDFDEKTALVFVEKWLLPAINACPVDLAHDIANAALILEGLPLATLSEETEECRGSTADKDKIAETEERWSHSLIGKSLKEKIRTTGPVWLTLAAQLLRRAREAMGPDFFRIHPKGHGSIVLTSKIPPNTLVTFYRGEVYPSWRWGEKMDAIDITQARKQLKPNLPDFYNMALERPQKDPRKYGLLFVDASRKAGHGSSISHSCAPTCEVRVAAVNGELCLAMTTLRQIEMGEELTFDYNAVTESLVEYRSAICLCGYGKCRGSFLHFATADCYQRVLDRNLPIAVRFASLARGCLKEIMSEEDERTLQNHGFKTAAFGAISVNRHTELAGSQTLMDSMDNVPVWLRTFVADTLRYIEYERRALPISLICEDFAKTNDNFLCRTNGDKGKTIKKKLKRKDSKEITGDDASEEENDKKNKRIKGSSPLPSFFYYSAANKEKFAKMLRAEGHNELTLPGLEWNSAIKRIAGAQWKLLSDAEKAKWKKKSQQDWEKNGGREKAELEKKRKQTLSGNSTNEPEAKKPRKSNKEAFESKLQSSGMSFQTADAEGVAAMEQRIQQLTQTLSRVGRVLDRHRETCHGLKNSAPGTSSDALRNQALPPLAVAQDEQVVAWLWNDKNALVRTLLAKIEDEGCVSPALKLAAKGIMEKYKVLGKFGSHSSPPKEFPIKPYQARKKLTAALMDFRRAINKELKQMAKDMKRQKLRGKANNKRLAGQEEKKKRSAKTETSRAPPVETAMSSIEEAEKVDNVDAEGDAGVNVNGYNAEMDDSVDAYYGYGDALRMELHEESGSNEAVENNDVLSTVVVEQPGLKDAAADLYSALELEATPESQETTEVCATLPSLRRQVKTAAVNGSEGATASSAKKASSDELKKGCAIFEQEDPTASVVEDLYIAEGTAESTTSVVWKTKDTSLKYAQIRSVSTEKSAPKPELQTSPTETATFVVPENPKEHIIRVNDDCVGGASAKTSDHVVDAVEKEDSTETKAIPEPTAASSDDAKTKSKPLAENTHGDDAAKDSLDAKTGGRSDTGAKAALIVAEMLRQLVDGAVAQAEQSAALTEAQSEQLTKESDKARQIEVERLRALEMEHLVTEDLLVTEKEQQALAEKKKHEQVEYDNMPKPWLDHYSQRFKLQASADVLLMYARTSTFFLVQPYQPLQSTPIEVYAREIGNAVPRSVIDNALSDKTNNIADNKDDVQKKSDDASVLPQQGAKKTASSKFKRSSKMREKELRKEEELCQPDDIVAEVTVAYQGDYVLSQLLQWYNAGIGQAPGLPDSLGCIRLPPISGCWDMDCAPKINKPTPYESLTRPILVEWFRDPHKRGSAWSEELRAAFTPNGSGAIPKDVSGVWLPLGSPVLDLLVTGDDFNIQSILQEFGTDDDDRNAENKGLLSTVDEGRPAQAVSNWVCCENPICGKWRKIPWYVDIDVLAKSFVCSDNKWNTASNTCDAPEDEYEKFENDVVKPNGQIQTPSPERRRVARKKREGATMQDKIMTKKKVGSKSSKTKNEEDAKALKKQRTQEKKRLKEEIATKRVEEEAKRLAEDVPIPVDPKKIVVGGRFDVKRGKRQIYAVGKVVEITTDEVSGVRRAKFHFTGRDAKYDEILEIGSPNICPLYSKVEKKVYKPRKPKPEEGSANAVPSSATILGVNMAESTQLTAPPMAEIGDSKKRKAPEGTTSWSNDYAGFSGDEVGARKNKSPKREEGGVSLLAAGIDPRSPLVGLQCRSGTTSSIEASQDALSALAGLASLANSIPRRYEKNTVSPLVLTSSMGGEPSVVPSFASSQAVFTKGPAQPATPPGSSITASGLQERIRQQEEELALMQHLRVASTQPPVPAQERSPLKVALEARLQQEADRQQLHNQVTRALEAELTRQQRESAYSTMTENWAAAGQAYPGQAYPPSFSPANRRQQQQLPPPPPQEPPRPTFADLLRFSQQGQGR